MRKQVRALALLLLIAKLMPSGATAQQRSESAPRHIIICVDGVGISTINKMRAEGRFQMFRPPSRMISPFPSLTNLSLSEILEPAGAHPTAGYEDNYFDAESNTMRGGILDRLRGGRFIRGTFRELFDYHPSAIKSGLGYAAPPLTTYLESLSDLIRLRQKARGARGPVFFAYTGATDSLAHLGGETLVRSFLKRLDESITDIVRDSREPVDVTIFSDHGNHFRKYRRANLKSALRRAGFRLEKRLKGEKSVVLPQFGLIGCALLFTGEANEPRLAEAAASVAGVDFAAYEKEGAVYVVSAQGEAVIERRAQSVAAQADDAAARQPAARFRYRTLRGDPLGLGSVLRELTARGKADGEGFVADADWFEATRDGVRPDAVRRIFDGATGLVGSRASVLVNFEDGYYTGSSLLDVFAILQATHGNLGQEQSFGFVMSTHRDLPAYIRAGDLWQSIGSPQLRKSISSR